MYDHLRFRHSIVAAAKLAGLCGLLTAVLLLPATAEAEDLPDFFKEFDIGASELDQERGSDLHPDRPVAVTKPGATAVILWDEWQRRTVSQSGVTAANSGPDFTIHVGPQVLYRAGYPRD